MKKHKRSPSPSKSATGNSSRGLLFFHSRRIELYFLPLLLLLVLVLGLKGSSHPSLWGINLSAYLATGWLIGVAVFVIEFFTRRRVLDLLFPVFQRLGTWLFPASPARALIIHATMAVGMVALASTFRMPFSFLGDGAAIVRTLYTDHGTLFSFPGTLWIEPLTVLLYKILLGVFADAAKIGSGVDLRSYTEVFATISIASGGVFIFLLLRLIPRVTEDAGLRMTAFVLTAASGGLLLFFGYVEYYAPMYILGTGFLLSAIGTLKDGTRPFLPLLFLAGAIAFHLATLVLVVPALVLWRESQGRPEDAPFHPWRLPLAFLGLGFFGYLGLNILGLNRFFIPLTSSTDGFAFLTASHARDVLNTLLLHGAAPLTLLLGLLVYHRGRIPTTPALRFALVSVLALVLLVAVHSAIARDWDVYVLLGPALALAAVLGLENTSATSSDETVPLRVTAPVFSLTALLLVSIWIAVNVQFPLAFRRYNDLTSLYEPILPARVSAGHLETLRTAAVASNDRTSEAWFMMRSFLLTGDHYDFYKLQRALSSIPMPPSTLRLPFEACIDKALTLAPAGRRFPPAELGLDSLRYEDLVVLSFGKYATMIPPKDRWEWIRSRISRLEGRVYTAGLTASLLGRAAADIGRWEDAEHYLRLALRDSSGLVQRDGAQLARGLAIVLLQQNRLAESSDFFQLSTTLTGATADCWASWGYSLLRQNRLEEAANVLATALEKDPDNQDGLFFLGKLYLSRPDYRARGEELLIRYLTKHPTASNVAQAKALLGVATP